MLGSHVHPSGEYIAILDAGSQFGKVIDRKVRELDVESVILPLDTPTDQLLDTRLRGIIISGGPSSVCDRESPSVIPKLFELGKPVLGICYGMQLLAYAFGGDVCQSSVGEYGQNNITIDETSLLFKGLGQEESVLLTHGDCVVEVGSALRVTARSPDGIIAAIEHRALPLFGVQFHPEVDLTVNGKTIFKNFLSLCGCSFNFTPQDREAAALRIIRESAHGEQKVLCLASGGVDSTVCAALLIKALGPERVVCIHIDHGFMRLNESAEVIMALEKVGVRVILVDAREEFAQATTEMPAKGDRPAYRTKRLCETVNPEEKRSIIGDTFMRVCDRVTRELNLDAGNLLLAQGTLRPDLIESGSAHASTQADAIKTHHNDTALVRKLRDTGRIIEPLADYHKDEVRELGTRLGLPRALVERQPFPGPGLAIRILCSDGTPFQDENFASTESMVREICAGHLEGVEKSVKLAIDTLAVSSCVLPLRTVGVQGDSRSYAYAAALSLGHCPTAEEWKQLACLAKFIPTRTRTLNRVVFMFGERQNDPPLCITQVTLKHDVVEKLRIADDIVNRVLVTHALVRKLSQVPIILIPIGFEQAKAYSVVVRTFITNDFMTGVPGIPGTPVMPLAVLKQIVDELCELSFVSRVMYDLTAKPPGTTEWE